MKRAAVPVAILAAGVMAQELTTTVTYSVCPTATTTTITLPTTITYCPGGFCNVTPTGPVGPGGTVTTTATTTSYITVFPAPCPNKKGLCDASYTIWEECPCTEHRPGYIPKDFTTTLHKCNTCGSDGSPTEYTRTLPCTTGAYATVTPSFGGKWVDGPHPEIPVAGEEWSDNGSGPAGAAPVAGANGDEWSDAGKGAAPVAPANGAPAAPVADASNGAEWADASGAPVAPGSDSPVAPAEGGKSDVADYTGAGNKAALALSTVFAGVVGALAMML